ncbi:hypothetical protein RRG08_049944 [Elysia crispata]|uniref:Uncharacterized protein n=1 Tax=Elysia crispata TaxID=231223 RepID=A0AAE1E422_9GAST|nr:hypothetical protein RRG08_049944 [Elysia crispata]
MAASSDRMTKAAYLAKQMCLQDLKDDYILKLENFLIDVETSMQSQNKDRANEIFETAIDFLTQPFPDVQNMRANPSTPNWGATSVLGSLLGSPRSICERTNFHAKDFDESWTPGIEDVLLVSEKLMLQSVYSNNSVKLFTEQDDHLHSLEVNGSPLRLALIDSGPGNTWKVAVTLPSDRRIALLEVTPDSVTQLTSIQTSGLCYAITAVDTATLAVGYHDHPGIDMIDMTGRVLRRLGQSLHPRYMTVTQDGCLFMSTRDNKVAKTAVLKNEHPLPSELMDLRPTQRINYMASLERMFDEGEINADAEKIGDVRALDEDLHSHALLVVFQALLVNWHFTHSAPAGGGLPGTACELGLHTLCTCWWWSSRHFL